MYIQLKNTSIEITDAKDILVNGEVKGTYDPKTFKLEVNGEVIVLNGETLTKKEDVETVPPKEDEETKEEETKEEEREVKRVREDVA
jgi:alpha-acetolactate decarboxylase